VDVRLKRSVNKATLHQYTQRQAIMPDLPDANGLRTLAGIQSLIGLALLTLWLLNFLGRPFE